MIDQISTFFSYGMIYLWLTLGVLPFWFLMLFFPQSRICKIFVTSIFPILILAAVDLYLIVQMYNSGINLLGIFNLYLGLNELLLLFSDENYVLIFWIHFLAINLFCGSWITRDYQKIAMPKFFAFISIISAYFVGPFGLLFYWFIRIFFSKKIDLYD